MRLEFYPDSSVVDYVCFAVGVLGVLFFLVISSQMASPSHRLEGQ